MTTRDASTNPQSALPQEEKYQPQTLPASWKDLYISNVPPSLAVNLRRKNIFDNITFMFCDADLTKRNKEMIETGGGKVFDASRADINQSFLDSHRSHVLVGSDKAQTNLTKLKEIGYTAIDEKSILKSIFHADTEIIIKKPPPATLTSPNPTAQKTTKSTKTSLFDNIGSDSDSDDDISMTKTEAQDNNPIILKKEDQDSKKQEEEKKKQLEQQKQEEERRKKQKQEEEKRRKEIEEEEEKKRQEERKREEKKKQEEEKKKQLEQKREAEERNKEKVKKEDDESQIIAPSLIFDNSVSKQDSQDESQQPSQTVIKSRRKIKPKAAPVKVAEKAVESKKRSREDSQEDESEPSTPKQEHKTEEPKINVMFEDLIYVKDEAEVSNPTSSNTVTGYNAKKFKKVPVGVSAVHFIDSQKESIESSVESSERDQTKEEINMTVMQSMEVDDDEEKNQDDVFDVDNDDDDDEDDQLDLMANVDTKKKKK
ncbi:hypothetical protein AKO1_001888 [Acrasis kona]|uniref:Nibrin second BRCT domain-containing protein n=1 Tax=Acrasis kona TaxID=1008807 RepID=A0AAW2ZA77_9EUKA